MTFLSFYISLSKTFPLRSFDFLDFPPSLWGEEDFSAFRGCCGTRTHEETVKYLDVYY